MGIRYWYRHHMGLFKKWLWCKWNGHEPKLVHRHGFRPACYVCQRCGVTTKDPAFDIGASE